MPCINCRSVAVKAAANGHRVIYVTHGETNYYWQICGLCSYELWRDWTKLEPLPIMNERQFDEQNKDFATSVIHLVAARTMLNPKALRFN